MFWFCVYDVVWPDHLKQVHVSAPKWYLQYLLFFSLCRIISVIWLSSLWNRRKSSQTGPSELHLMWYVIPLLCSGSVSNLSVDRYQADQCDQLKKLSVSDGSLGRIISVMLSSSLWNTRTRTITASYFMNWRSSSSLHRPLTCLLAGILGGLFNNEHRAGFNINYSRGVCVCVCVCVSDHHCKQETVPDWPQWLTV